MGFMEIFGLAMAGVAILVTVWIIASLIVWGIEYYQRRTKRGKVRKKAL